METKDGVLLILSITDEEIVNRLTQAINANKDNIDADDITCGTRKYARAVYVWGLKTMIVNSDWQGK